MNDPLRVSLWNWFATDAIGDLRDKDDEWRRATRNLFDEFFKIPVDEMSPYAYQCRDTIKKAFFALEWWGVYNLIEYVVPRLRSYHSQYSTIPETATTRLNVVLAREMSAYRWLAGTLTPITSTEELAAVSQASTRQRASDGPAVHIKAAVGMLGKKPEPDYRNSIKESISAVEAAVNSLTGEDGGVDDALRLLEKRGDLHPALKFALSKLYAYTSDKDGIRHAILEQQTVTFDEAKFMLVACSAFVNFLLGSIADRG